MAPTDDGLVPRSVARSTLPPAMARYLRVPGADNGQEPLLYRGVPALLSNGSERLALASPSPDTLVVDGFTLPELTYLSRYLPSLGAASIPMRQVLHGWLSQWAPHGVALAVEAGCGVGADLRALRLHARQVIGFDLMTAAIKVARQHLAGVPLPAWRRLEGRHFAHDGDWLLPPVDGVFACLGDALEPPVVPGVADVVVALNLLDNVPDPLVLLTALDAMLKPGGLLILASPFAWRDELTAPEAQLGGGTIPALVELGSPQALAALLSGATPLLPDLRHTVLATTDVPWELADHARCRMIFTTHMLLTRKAFSHS